MPDITAPMGIPNTVALPAVCTFDQSSQQLKNADQIFRIAGVTRDLNGAPLGNCVVSCFRTDNNTPTIMMSDANGNYSFAVSPAYQYYLVAYLPGSPDVAGTTVNTLVGT